MTKKNIFKLFSTKWKFNVWRKNKLMKDGVVHDLWLMIGSNLATTYEFFIKVILLAYSVWNCGQKIIIFVSMFKHNFVIIFGFYFVDFWFLYIFHCSGKRNSFISFSFSFLLLFFSFLISRSLNEFRSSAYSAAEYELFNCHSVSDTLTMFACGQYVLLNTEHLTPNTEHGTNFYSMFRSMMTLHMMHYYNFCFFLFFFYNLNGKIVFFYFLTFVIRRKMRPVCENTCERRDVCITTTQLNTKKWSRRKTFSHHSGTRIHLNTKGISLRLAVCVF